jgi:hypothetical protein
MWSLSPAVSSDSVEATLRSALFSCTTWLLSLHSLSRDSNPTLLSLAPGLVVVEDDERYAALRSLRLQLLLRVLSAIPLFDVRPPLPLSLSASVTLLSSQAMRPCFELISLLAEATFPNADRPLLSPEDNQALPLLSSLPL